MGQGKGILIFHGNQAKTFCTDGEKCLDFQLVSANLSRDVDYIPMPNNCLISLEFKDSQKCR